MAITKITDLDALTALADDDLFLVEDVSETATKKVTFANLRQSETKDFMMQSDNTDQAISDVSVARLITFDTDVAKQGIARTSSSRFTVATAGQYLICFSGIAQGKGGQSIAVWLRSGTHANVSTDSDNVANSNTLYQFKSDDLNTVISVSFIVTFTAGQWFEFLTWGSATTSFWNYTAAVTGNAGTPARPACPSIIFTANRI